MEEITYRATALEAALKIPRDRATASEILADAAAIYKFLKGEEANGA